MLAGSVRWSVEARTRHPAAAAARTFSSNVGSPSEKRVWVWQSTMGVDTGVSSRLGYTAPMVLPGT